jgi:hypothetical protein
MVWLQSGTSVEHHELLTGGTTSWMKSENWSEDNTLLRISTENFKIILSFIFKTRSRSTLRAAGFGVWNPLDSRDLYLPQIVQTGSGAHSACYSIGSGVLSLGVKRSEREVNIHLHLVSGLRMIGAIIVLPLHGFMTRTRKALFYALNSTLCYFITCFKTESYYLRRNNNNFSCGRSYPIILRPTA